jgi:hypothetical protein
VPLVSNLTRLLADFASKFEALPDLARRSADDFGCVDQLERDGYVLRFTETMTRAYADDMRRLAELYREHDSAHAAL